MHKISTLIVDDEHNSRKTLHNFLLKYCPDVEIVAEAASVAEAAQAIRYSSPELIFLDISMPEENGFELFQKIPEPAFHTVFVTAHDEYAFKAIKHHALDYILKPVSIEELIKTVSRVKALRETGNNLHQLKVMLESVQRPVIPDRIALPVSDGLIYVDLRNIIRCEAEGSYTQIHFTNCSKITVCRTLSTYEDMLKGCGFVRIHHRHLINLSHVEKYQRGRGGVVIMSDKKEVEVAQRRRDEFLEHLENTCRD